MPGPSDPSRAAWTLTRLRAACAALLLAHSCTALQAQPGVAPAAEPLLLDVSVNGKPIPGINPVDRLADGRLVLPTALWTLSRLRPVGGPLTLQDGSPGYVLDAVAGIAYRLDRSRLALDITAPAAAFDATELSMRGAQSTPQAGPPGVYVNHDLSVTGAQGSATRYGALLEAVGFGRWGALVSSAVLRGDARAHSAIRLDTFWRTDLPGRMASLVVGDTVGTGGAWSRPVRYGGVRYARDFKLAPGFLTYPSPSISGSAALPSTVDVLINNQRSAQSSVLPGPFEITHVPIVTGAGQMQLVVRDLLGRETVINQSYYMAPALLAPGLSDFSIEAGALRQNHGVRSHHYGALFGAGTYRRAINNTLTAEVRAEVDRERTAAGAAIVAVVADVAVVGLAAGHAVSRGERGGHQVASVQRSTPGGGLSVVVEHFDRGFRQLGDGAFEPRPRRQVVAGGGLTLGLGITAGMSFTQRTTWQGARFSLVGGNLAIALPGNMVISAYATRELTAGNKVAASLQLTVPFGQQRQFVARSARDPSGQVEHAVRAAQAVPGGPGWGWSVAASDGAVQRLQAASTFNSRHAQFTADASTGGGYNAVRLGANGSLGWMSGLPFASRRIDHGAFAVVHVGDLEGVGVSLSNQVVATTNSRGMALVTGLLPYQINRLTVDADLLPVDVEIGGVREEVVPYARSGALVNFPVRRSRDALVLLHQADGTPVPAGAQVTVSPGGQSHTVARRGEVYLVGLSDANRLGVRWKHGACTLELKLAPAASGSGPARVGPLVCGGAP